jgi:hypothetical protein
MLAMQVCIILATEFGSTLRVGCRHTNPVGRTGAYLSWLCCTGAKSDSELQGTVGQEQEGGFREAGTRRTMPPWTCRIAKAVEHLL